MRQASFSLGLVSCWAFALWLFSPALQAQGTPKPPISVAYDSKAWDELLQTTLGRTVYFEVRAQVAATIAEQIRKAELDDDGKPREIKDLARVRALEKWFDQLVNPSDGKAVLDSKGHAIYEMKNVPLAQGVKAVSRQEYYLQQIEKSLLETSGATRGRPAWLDQSLNNWRQIFSDLRSMTVAVAYHLEVLPNFKSTDVFLSDPKLLHTAVDGDKDIARARILARLAPDVNVKSISGYIEMPNFTYQLPLFPEYGQTWKFANVTGAVDLATTLDVSAEAPFFANFGPLATNLGEEKDAEGNVIWNGVQVSKKDVDYFLDQLLKVERYEKIIKTFYSPDEWDEVEGMAGPFKELPIARKIMVQTVHDAKNVLSERKIPLILYLYRVGEKEVEVGYALKADPALDKTLQSLRQDGKLIGLFDGDIALTATPSVDVDLERREMHLGIDLPPQTEVTFQVRELNFPQFLFKDAKNPIVRRILDSLPKGNLVGPDAKVKVMMKNLETPADFVGPPLHNSFNDIRMTIPYTYMTPSEWRLKHLEGVIKKEEAIVGHEARVESLKQERQNLQSEIANKVRKEYPTFVIEEERIQVNFSGLSTAYISQIEAHLNPGIPPLVLRPQSERSLAQQGYDQVPVLLQNIRAILPKKTIKTIESSIQDRLQEMVKKINKKVSQPGISFNVEITDFQLPADAVEIKWDGVRDPAKHLEAIDPLLLSTAYPYLYKLPAKHELTTVLKVPKKMGIMLRNIDSKKAQVPWLSIEAGSDEEAEVTIQWKIVEDAAGELHTLPYVWNFPEVLNGYHLTKMDYGGTSPKGGVEGLVDAAADFSGGMGMVAGLVKGNGVQIVEGGLSDYWVGRRLNNIGVGWLMGQGANAIGWGYEKVGGGIKSGYTNYLERPSVEEEVKKAFEEAKPGLVDVILEQAVDAVNGELKPDLPLDAEIRKKQKADYVRERLIYDDVQGSVEYINPVTSFEEREAKALKQRMEAWKSKEEKQAEAEEKERKRKARALIYEAEWDRHFTPAETPKRDPDSPMQALQRTFEEAFETVEDFAPVRTPLGAWKIKGQPLLSMIETRVRTVMQEAVNGERSEFWPEELTNARMVQASENELIPAIRRQVTDLPKDNKQVVEGVIQPDKLVGSKTNEAVNALIEKALRGEMNTASLDPTPRPIPEPEAKFKLDLPTVVCRGLPMDPDGTTNDSMVLLNLYRNADRSQLPAGLLKENPQAEIQKKVEALMYWDDWYSNQGSELAKDLSEEGQRMRNEILGNDPEFRTAKGAAIFDLKSLLETMVKPNVDGMIRDLEAKIVKEQGLANDSLHIGVSNINIRVGPKPQTGEQGFVVDFDLEVKQKGIGKDGIVHALSSLLGMEINTTGSKPWFSDEGDPKPLHITWPLTIMLSNRAHQRPEFDGQEIKPGYDAYLQSDFPIKLEGPNASRTLETQILIKGPLLDALRDFKTNIPIDRSIGIPTLEKYTQVELRAPMMMPSQQGMGYAVIPFSIQTTPDADALPKQLDEEIVMHPMEKLVPHLLGQSEKVLYNNAAQALIPKLSEKYRDVSLQFSAPQDGLPALRQNENGELEYHVSVAAKHSSFTFASGRYELVYKVATLLEHDEKGADLVGRLSAPQLKPLVSKEVLLHVQSLYERDFMHDLARADSSNFVWDRVLAKDLSKVSYR